jgi:hypothetical protein
MQAPPAPAAKPGSGAKGLLAHCRAAFGSQCRHDVKRTPPPRRRQREPLVSRTSSSLTRRLASHSSSSTPPSWLRATRLRRPARGGVAGQRGVNAA